MQSEKCCNVVVELGTTHTRKVCLEHNAELFRVFYFRLAKNKNLHIVSRSSYLHLRSNASLRESHPRQSLVSYLPGRRYLASMSQTQMQADWLPVVSSLSPAVSFWLQFKSACRCPYVRHNCACSRWCANITSMFEQSYGYNNIEPLRKIGTTEALDTPDIGIYSSQHISYPEVQTINRVWQPSSASLWLVFFACIRHKEQVESSTRTQKRMTQCSKHWYSSHRWRLVQILKTIIWTELGVSPYSLVICADKWHTPPNLRQPFLNESCMSPLASLYDEETEQVCWKILFLGPSDWLVSQLHWTWVWPLRSSLQLHPPLQLQLSVPL